MVQWRVPTVAVRLAVVVGIGGVGGVSSGLAQGNQGEDEGQRNKRSEDMSTASHEMVIPGTVDEKEARSRRECPRGSPRFE